MLTPLDISEEKILEHLRTIYDLPVTSSRFLPIGADINSAVYRITTLGSGTYFLKLRRGNFSETSLTVPAFLHRELGLSTVLAPLPTARNQLWTQAHGFYWMLYPFIEGDNGFERNLLERQWVKLGGTLRAIHRASLPSTLLSQIPHEEFALHSGDIVVKFYEKLPQYHQQETIVGQLTAFLEARRDDIHEIIRRTELLRQILLKADSRHSFVLCHADIHAGNVIVDEEALCIVDWDTLILAPKERDLMFVAGGIGGIWNKRQEEMLFYVGYGDVNIDYIALSYYRYERIVVDIAEFCTQIVDETVGIEDRTTGFELMKSQFLPNNVVEIAHKTYEQLS